MKLLRIIAGAALALGMAIWLAAIASAAVAAPNVFGTLDDDLPVHTAAYAAFEEAEQSRLVAGQIMLGVFTLVDRIMYVGAALAVIGGLIVMIPGGGWKRPSMLLMLLGLALASACCVLYIQMSPELYTLLTERFAAAEAGDIVKARAIVEQFDPLHERATMLFQIQLVGLVLSIAALGSGICNRGSVHTQDPHS